MRWSVSLLALLLVGCGSNPGEVKIDRFDKDVELVTSISGSGGALGDETYRVSYRFNGKETRFFEGVNPHDFEVTTGANMVSIKFCDGSVRLAQPIFLGPPRNQLVHLRLNLDCSDSNYGN